MNDKYYVCRCLSARVINGTKFYIYRCIGSFCVGYVTFYNCYSTVPLNVGALVDATVFPQVTFAKGYGKGYGARSSIRIA